MEMTDERREELRALLVRLEAGAVVDPGHVIRECLPPWGHNVDWELNPKLSAMVIRGLLAVTPTELVERLRAMASEGRTRAIMERDVGMLRERDGIHAAADEVERAFPIVLPDYAASGMADAAKEVDEALEAGRNDVVSLGHRLEAAEDDVSQLRLERDDATARPREIAQILIEEIGETGPERAEDTARRAVDLLRGLRAELAKAHEDKRREFYGDLLADDPAVSRALGEIESWILDGAPMQDGAPNLKKPKTYEGPIVVGMRGTWEGGASVVVIRQWVGEGGEDRVRLEFPVAAVSSWAVSSTRFREAISDVTMPEDGCMCSIAADNPKRRIMGPWHRGPFDDPKRCPMYASVGMGEQPKQDTRTNGA